MADTRYEVRQAFIRAGSGVATEQPLASAAASKILASGGNAVDASITASLVLAVTIPHLGGIGGDYFALIRTPDGRIDYIDGSGYSPSKLTRDLLLSKGYSRVPNRGPLAMTVPGMVDALHKMWRKYGSLEWKKLVEPAAELAEKGFPASPSLVRAIKAARPVLESDPGSKDTYIKNMPEKPGDIVRFPGLGKLLRLIAEDPRSFYEGEPAERMAEYIQDKGGVLSYDDLRDYQAEWASPIQAEYRGWKIWEMSPSTQGITTIHMLKILEQWKLPRDPVDRFYYILSAAPPAYRVRDVEVGDPRYMNITVKELLSDNYIEMLRNMARHGPPRCVEMNRGEGHGDTTYYSVVDSEGYMVSGIQSLFYPFGSALTEPTYQITLHGRANGFTLEPGTPNTVGPRKKPLHTLSAIIAESEDKIFAIGASGGHYRPQQHALFTTSIIDHGYTIGEAISAPRLLWTPWTCNIVADKEVDLSRLPWGYEIQYGRTGVGNAVMINGETRIIATDPRGDGFPFIQ